MNLEYRDAIKSADFPDKQIQIQMIPDANGNPWCYYEGEDRNLYIGEVGGGILANILQTNKAALFTMNIREYVGDSKTNKQIIDTALNNPHNFEYFNNGVTAVAGRVTPDENSCTLICEKLSIINGAQTVKSLLKATTRRSEKYAKPLSSVRVLFRLMSFKYPAEVPFIGDVTRFNNTQNALKIADFRSNDGVQKDLARRFGALNLNGKSYEYKNKRSDKKRNTIAITLEELAKSLHAFRFGPDDMYGGTSKLFDPSMDGLYRKIFPEPDQQLAESEFNLIAGTFLACQYAKCLWEQDRAKNRAAKKSLHLALERKWLIFFTIGEIERINYIKHGWDLDRDLSRLAKPNAWLTDKKGAPILAIEKAYEVASKVLIQQYDTKKKVDPAFRHRNWFRDVSTLSDIRSGIDLAFAFGETPKLWD